MANAAKTSERPIDPKLAEELDKIADANGVIAPTPTETKVNTATTAHSNAKPMPDQDKVSEEKAAVNAANETKEAEKKSWIERIVTALGFDDKTTEDNAKKDFREKADVGGVGKALNSSQIAATVKNVSGHDMNIAGLDPSILREASNAGRCINGQSNSCSKDSEYNIVPVVAQKSTGEISVL